MSFKDNWLFKNLAVLAPAALVFVASAAVSQDVIESEDVEAKSNSAAEESATVEEVVVTGSRLKRSTFTSISPLQIITADISRGTFLRLSG